MKILLSVLLVAFAAPLVTSATSKLGSLITEKCPEWGEISAPCYGRVLDNIISGIAQGVPKLNLPALDPLVVTPVNISVTGGEDQEFHMSFHAMNFTGLSKTRVSNIKVGNPLRLRLHLPRLSMRSPFTNEGRLVLFRAQGGGNILFSFAGVDMEFTLKYDETKNKDGERHAVIDSGKVEVKIDRSIIQLENLDNAGPLAEQLLNVFLSASSDEIVKALLPHINEAFSQQFVKIARNTVANLPLNEVFKPWEEPPAQ